MIRTLFMADYWNADWPRPAMVAPLFLDPKQREWCYWDGGNGGSFKIDGLNGSQAEQDPQRRANASLYIMGDRHHGISLFHRLWDGKSGQARGHHSRGDLSRRLDFVRTRDGDRVSVGLFIPFEMAWLAVEDFMTNDGQLSTRINWVNVDDLPNDTFPEPH
jgi:hypothetical protein